MGKKIALVCALSALTIGCRTLSPLGGGGGSKNKASKSPSGSEPAETANTSGAEGEEDPFANQPELTPEQEKLAEELGGHVDSLDYDANNQDDYDKHIAAAHKCLEIAQTLSDQGVPGRLLVNISALNVEGTVSKRTDYGGRASFAPLSALAPHCQQELEERISGYLAIQWAVDDLAEVREKKFEDETALVVYEQHAKKCTELVTHALEEYDAPPDMTLELEGVAEVTLGKANENICLKLKTAIETAEKEIIKRKERALAAKLAPYKKVLKADKWRLFKSRYMYKMDVRTKGGKLLSGPKAFARASVWCETLSDSQSAVPRWIVRCYRFGGHKLKGQKERSGRGENPPSRAYR